MRTLVPLAMAMLGGAIVMIDFFVAPGGVIGVTLLDAVMVLVAVALVVGLVNLAVSHVRRMLQGGEKGLSSAVLVGAMLVTLMLGLWPGSQGLNDPAVRWLIENVYVPISAALFALLAFYVASAAFRTLRARSVESGLLALGAVIVLLSTLPAVFLGLEIPFGIGQWFMDYPVVAGMRGIALGVAIGVIGTSFRVLAGIDRQYLS